MLVIIIGLILYCLFPEKKKAILIGVLCCFLLWLFVLVVFGVVPLLLAEFVL